MKISINIFPISVFRFPGFHFLALCPAPLVFVFFFGYYLLAGLTAVLYLTGRSVFACTVNYLFLTSCV